MKTNPSVIEQKRSTRTDFHPEYLLEAIFNHVQEGIFIIDADSNIIDINPEGLKIHGFNIHDKEYLIGTPFHFYSILDKNRQEISERMNPVLRVLANEQFSNEQYFVRFHENSPEVFLSYRGLPQVNEVGDPIAGVLFAQPVQESFSEIKDNFITHNRQSAQMSNRQLMKDDKDLFQLIPDAIPVMIVVYDSFLNVMGANRAFEEITGWTANYRDGFDMMELLYPDPDYRHEISACMSSPGFKDIVMRTREGRDIEVSWSNVSIEAGRQIGVGFDISDRKKLEKDLIKARERAEKENKVQHAFIQNISHEVRTPMNSILGFTELLQKELKQKKEAEFLNAIYYNGKQLLRLIDDIIDFSRLDNNQITVQKEGLNLNQMMIQIVKQAEAMKKAFKKRHLNLVLKQPEQNIQAIIDTDHLRLQQVMLNLISNAIKYTEEGYVEFGYEIRQANHDILFFVKDSGIGIEEVNANRVFRRFNRLHDTNRKEFRGTGLGLAICKHLVNLLGGEIWYKSKPGKGTAFYFNHPYKALEGIAVERSIPETTKNENPSEAVMPGLNNKVILIVEDDSFSYMMMYHMIEESKAIILHADTGRKAIEIFEKYNVDLVFLDIRLPEMDGYQVLKYMRQQNKKVPVVAQTANALPEDKKMIWDAGFNGYITKPISRNSLLDSLYRFFC